MTLPEGFRYADEINSLPEGFRYADAPAPAPEPLVVTDKSYDFSVYRQQGYSDDQILNAMLKKEPLLKTYIDQGYSPAQIIGAIEQKKQIGQPEKSGTGKVNWNDLSNTDPTAKKTPNWNDLSDTPIVQQVGTVPLPQPDNSHTVAWGTGVAVLVAVSLLAWFKFKKTETTSGVSAAAQSPIHEQTEKGYAVNEPHAPLLGTTKGNAMSQNQKRILMVVLAIVAAMFVYPPFQVINNNGMAFNMGYGWIFDSPKRGSIIANVNVPMLLIQWVGVLIVGGIAFFLAKGSPEVQRASGSSAANENPIHEQPDPLLGVKLEKLERAENLFFISLLIDIAVTVIALVSSAWALGVLKDIDSGVRTLDQPLASTIDFWGSFSMVMILTTIGVGLGLINWLSSCYQFAKGSLHATGFKQEWWLGPGWIFPFFNLFKPYQVINEIYRAGSLTYNRGDDWKKESGSGLLLTWWIFWAVTHFLMITIGKATFKKTLLHDLTIPQIIGAYEVQVWLCAISIIIAGLWFVVANHLTQRLVDRSSRYAPKPSFSDSTKAAPISSAQRTVQNAPATVQHAPAVAKQADLIQTTPTESKPAMNNPPPVNAMPAPAIAIESSQQSMPEIEDRLYEQIAQEIESNAVDKGIWTKAFAQSGGDDKLTRVAYIKARFEKLMAAENAKLEALQREREEAARREQEQRDLERKEFERSEALRRRIKLRGLSDSDAVKDLEVSDESANFIARCGWGDLDSVTKSIMKNPLFLLVHLGIVRNTGLHMAVKNKHTDIAKFLAEEGALVNALNGNGDTPIDIAKKSRQADLAAFLQQFSVA